jgi:ABC-type transport system involved in Fe-S cluster assembly fused permease/ATPase subunit
METILRSKVRSSLKTTLAFVLVITLLYYSRLGSAYLDNFLTNALFLIVIKLCMVMYALYWVSQMIEIWENRNAEMPADKKAVR